MSTVHLTDLLHALALPDDAVTIQHVTPQLTISGITQDSRKVEKGWLFAAIVGEAHNGEHYIEAALDAGASVILCRKESAELVAGKAAILVENPRRILSLLSVIYHQPQPSHIVAVTGTDGKTSTAEFTRQFWELSGHAALSVGTLGLRSATILENMPMLSENTSPEPVTFYEALARACQQGIFHVVCEASSHGIVQHRLDGIAPSAAVFTSFSQDHLDYHHTMDAYFAAKARLFRRLLPETGTAILCADYDDLLTLADELRDQGKPVITYGKGGDLDIQAITPIPSGQHVVFLYEGQEYEAHFPVFGEFQVYNMLAAMLAASVTSGPHVAQLVLLCDALVTIRGRLELAGRTPEGALIFIDYAHTPAALEKALHTLIPYAQHEVHIVFGCGGNRDKEKRPLMGAVAQRMAHHVIVTDDNPRHESPDAIRAEICATCPKAQNIPDRREAIATAMRALSHGDVLLIAGKGHEDYQIIGDVKYHSDDAEIVHDVLGEMMLRD